MDTAGFAGILTHRSSAGKRGISIYGLIDPDYRGPIYIPVSNVSNEPIVIERGSCIAQIRFVELPQVKLKEVQKLDETKRGGGSFGSTG
jgi:dUTP pyrophosphatase